MTEIIGISILIVAVLLGGGIVVVLQKADKQTVIKLLLSLSGGFLLAISFVHLIPEIYLHHGQKMGYYILLGFLIQLFLEYFSGGIEHGHVHIHGKKGAMPWTLFISLSVHTFIEGIPLEAQFHEGVGEIQAHLHHHHHHEHVQETGNRFGGLFLGVVLHNIPVAIALMTLLLASGFTKLKAWIILGIFSLMAPLGIIFGHFGAANYLIDIELLLAVVVGMFLHISTTIIFEASENHKFNFLKLISLVVGVLLAVFTMH
jgi:zinc transporter ZupT